MSAENVREFAPEFYHCTLGPHEPALSLQAKDTLVTTCVDAGGMDADGNKISPEQLAGPWGARQQVSNPLTGPFFVDGAEPGDALAVRIEEVTPTRDWAWSGNWEEFGFFSIEELYGPTTFTRPQWAPQDQRDFRWELDRDRGVGRLQLPRSRLQRIEIPLHPFLGCIGVCPERGETRMTMTPGRHGGNMDCPVVRAGATIYFPVFAPGGLLCMGDCHAAQGDGEICGIALEVSCQVRFTVDVVKGWTITWPRVEDDEHIMAIGSVRPLRAAYAVAHVELLEWLVRDYGFERFEAYQVLSQVGTTQVGNVVDPNYSVVARFPKRYLP